MYNDTRKQFESVATHCRSLFVQKLHDYGASWRIMRPESLTDQIYIKANRIRNLQMTGQRCIDEGIEGEFVAIVNYGIIALIQLSMGVAVAPDIDESSAVERYDQMMQETMQLMLAKNHDYGEAWRQMRVSSFADLILTKVYRTKQIEDLDGETFVSEGVGANYMDMINYAVFALISLCL